VDELDRVKLEWDDLKIHNENLCTNVRDTNDKYAEISEHTESLEVNMEKVVKENMEKSEFIENL
jgi:hypothetical protein